MSTETKPTKPPRLPLIVALLNLVATAATATLVVLVRPDAAVQAPDEAESVAAEPVFAELDPFLVNLDEPGTPRYLKTTVQVELVGADPLAALEQRKPAVRDRVLTYLSGLRIEDTRGAANKEKIRNDLVARVAEELGAETVTRLFLSEFVVQ